MSRSGKAVFWIFFWLTILGLLLMLFSMFVGSVYEHPQVLLVGAIGYAIGFIGIIFKTREPITFSSFSGFVAFVLLPVCVYKRATALLPFFFFGLSFVASLIEGHKRRTRSENE